MGRVDVLVRIKRLVIARRVEFTMKATEERLRDGLSVEDILGSIVNANAIKQGAALTVGGTGRGTRAVVRDREPDVRGNVGLHEGNGPP